MGGPVSRLFPISFFPYTNPHLFFSLATGARRQHRGPRTDGKKSLNRQSYQRREKLFNAAVPNNEAALHELPTEASRDHRTKEEIDAVLPWVSHFLAIVVLPSNIVISRLQGLWLNIRFSLPMLLVLLRLLPHARTEQMYVCSFFF